MIIMDLAFKMEFFRDDELEQDSETGIYLYPADFDLRVTWGSHEPSDKWDVYAHSGPLEDSFHLDIGPHEHGYLNTDKAIYDIDFFQDDDISSEVIKSDPSFLPEVDLTRKTVLALQLPYDKAVIRKGCEEVYWQWVMTNAFIYKNSLVCKIHPFMDNRHIEKAIENVNPYGATVHFFDLRTMSRAKLVLAYTSQIVFDCWMRGVKCSLFHKTAYSKINGITSSVPEYGRKAANFIMFNYFMHKDIERFRLLEMLEMYARKRSFCRVPREYSWGQQFIEEASR